MSPRCRICYKAETPKWRQIRDNALGTDPLVSQHIFQASLVHALMGGEMYQDIWYKEHRDQYVETGDPLELKRMLRHVK